MVVEKQEQVEIMGGIEVMGGEWILKARRMMIDVLV
jgi:hypothetical protein